ncbi:TIGR01777 family oxidoreductase [Spirilliplanes yamanashiensis]|uniref:Epimerase n=1 Tax=Spirilliplanes yamanashiensis TaxID=42233 RepID=A0A8J3Y8M0_9ACTN|nr:TIGR01777 family oxidoreductase [Spirilliplanes yamanashiensis]MDP9816815.1 uncharacterized protein (TIGR01777 family) [Spirilliplanes yamanashiensis]GIJ03530.1 epimerase [Spirilliplanes yamanashiensis]
MRIIVAGASGFLGIPLVERLRAEGHEVTRLVRRKPAAPDELGWNPAAGHLDPARVQGADAVVNIGGAGVGDKRWTPGYKDEIRTSRVEPTTLLATTIAQLPPEQRPRVFLQGSAVGWYGDTGDTPVEEDAPAGAGFLADVCRVWEAAVRPAEDAGVRVALLRTGLPLDAKGGLLKPQLLPFKLGVGGKLGSGRQWVPWISLEDWVSAVVFVLERDDIHGPVNLVGPEPVRNARFTEAFAGRLHRPAIMPIPGVGLRVLLGEFAGEALRSQRVRPGVLSRAGFTWRHTTVEEALGAALAG